MKAKKSLEGIVSWSTYITALILQIATWFLLYPLAGYNDITVNIASGSYLVLGLGLVLGCRLGWQRTGMGWDKLLKALPVAGLTYAFFLLLGLLLRGLGLDVAVLRDQYNLYALASNWVLTGLGEELVFAGIILTLTIARLNGGRRWLAIIIVASMFAVWHLPGYFAIGMHAGNIGISIFFRLMLNFLSWVVFGTIYLLSRNLWLTAIAHASTDYALLPMLIDVPILGLAFMMTLAGLGWFIENYRGYKNVGERASGVGLSPTGK
ncbi:MAG: CPBP family intramembrane metalloprotease [Firmicutes bacterium]|nr:CPBP family intramembrane metalloprotease [Bacillota bacterium]